MCICAKYLWCPINCGANTLVSPSFLCVGDHSCVTDIMHQQMHVTDNPSWCSSLCQPSCYAYVHVTWVLYLCRSKGESLVKSFPSYSLCKGLMREFTVRKLCHCHQHFPFRHSYRSLISVIIHDIKPFLQVHERQLPSMLPLTILASQVTLVLEHFWSCVPRNKDRDRGQNRVKIVAKNSMFSLCCDGCLRLFCSQRHD